MRTPTCVCIHAQTCARMRMHPRPRTHGASFDQHRQHRLRTEARETARHHAGHGRGHVPGPIGPSTPHESRDLSRARHTQATSPQAREPAARASPSHGVPDPPRLSDTTRPTAPSRPAPWRRASPSRASVGAAPCPTPSAACPSHGPSARIRVSPRPRGSHALPSHAPRVPLGVWSRACRASRFDQSF